MDISNRFSLRDFLAFLFPGIFTGAGLYITLLLTPLKSELLNMSIDFGIGVIFLILSFILGVVVSGISEILTYRIRHKNDKKVPLKMFEKEIKKVFSLVFGGKTEFQWTREHFYLCRSIIIQHMPNVNYEIQRQSGLRQLRMSLLFPILIWILAGILWGLQIYWNISSQWGITLISLSIILGYFLIVLTIDRMQNNDEREIRETLTAFLIGFETGVFKRVKSSK